MIQKQTQSKMGYDSEPVMKPSPEDRKTLMDLVILTWVQACEANGLPKSQGILSLKRFMTDQGGSKKWIADRILQFFTEQGRNADEILEIWTLINKPE